MKEFQQTKQIAPRMGENLSQLVLQTGVNIQNLHKTAKIKHSGRELPVNKTHRQLSKEETQAVNNYCKKWSVSLSRGECKLKLLYTPPPASQKCLLSRCLITSEDLERMWRETTLTHCCGEGKLWRSIQRFLKKLKVEYVLTKLLNSRQYTQITPHPTINRFAHLCFVMARQSHQPDCPSTGEQIMKTLYVNKMEYYSTIKKCNNKNFRKMDRFGKYSDIKQNAQTQRGKKHIFQAILILPYNMCKV